MKVHSHCNLKSAPGPDGIPYSILLKLECSHHILATLFNKVLAFGSPPPSWSESVIKLVHKKGSTSEHGKFRRLALSGCISKSFHLITGSPYFSQRTDETVQKAFLPGINRCIEHNIVMEGIIKDAKAKKQTAHITFFDLEDAFGSVPHSLISETLNRNHMPENVLNYLNNF